MTAARGREACLLGVTTCAKFTAGRRRKGVRPVTAGARLAARVGAVVGRRNRLMARRTRGSFERRVRRVRTVTIDASFGAPVNGSDVAVTSTTSGRSFTGSVRRVTIGAGPVARDDLTHQRGFGSMAPNAEASASGDEVVRLVTGEAAVMTGGFRSTWLLVAGGTSCKRGFGGSVGAMAVEAILSAGMRRVVRRPLLVTTLAGRRLQRFGLVRAVTSGARCYAVLDDGREFTLRSAVTIAARRSRAGCERVARKATRVGGTARVTVRRFVLVTAPANRHARVREASAVEIVTILADDRCTTHVRFMTCAGSILCPRRWHGDRSDFDRPPGKHAKESGDARGDERQEAGQCRQDRPTSRTHCTLPWQRRQGRSASLSRVLVKPRPWGLPPGPPTR